ncbi:TerD domain-containing protein (plasmid) [Embleya sp. NBC_00888]|uniref:TerD family protein n=1 Tax=Embleya sp. NBC_00888 TaxID=2975960 RepID=UPI002F906CA0|nr:TerD domain-containing protein [Embleya sp. NBC_00888]
MSRVVLTTGANAPLDDGVVEIVVSWEGRAGVDISALLLTAEHLVRGDADFVFWNNPASPDGAVRLAGGGRMTVVTSAVADDVASLVVVVAADGQTGADTLADVRGLQAVVGETVYRPDDLTRGQIAAVLVEVYRRADAWKVRAVGQGYASGLAGIATDFGIEVAEEPDDPPTDPERGLGFAIPDAAEAPPGFAGPTAPLAPVAFAPPAAQPQQQLPGTEFAAPPAAVAPEYATGFAAPVSAPVPVGFTPPPAIAPPTARTSAPPSGSPVSRALSRLRRRPDAPTRQPAPAPTTAYVPTPYPAAAPYAAAPLTMTKPPLGAMKLTKDQSVALPWDGDRSTVITAALEWDGGTAYADFGEADLDLYAMFVPRTEAVPPSDRRIPTKGAIYYRDFGSATAEPYVHLDGDARGPGREVIRITRPDLQGHVLICAYSALGNGAGSFKSYGAKAVVDDGRGSVVTVPLLDDNDNSYWVAIALIDFTRPEGPTVRHVERYSESDEQRPMLYADGRFAMSMGPTEFKDGTPIDEWEWELILDPDVHQHIREGHNLYP